MKNKIMIILLCLSFTCSAFGELVQIGFSAEISNLDDGDVYGWDNSVYEGLTIEGCLTYDTLSEDLLPQYSDAGEYYVISATMIAGNYQFSSGADSTFNIGFDDSLCRYSVFSSKIAINGTFKNDNNLVDAEEINWLAPLAIRYLDLKSYTGEITTDELPVDFPSISVFDSDKSFFIRLHPESSDYGLELIMSGTITDIWVIPEPCTILLFGLGGLGVIRRRK